MSARSPAGWSAVLATLLLVACTTPSPPVPVAAPVVGRITAPAGGLDGATIEVFRVDSHIAQPVVGLETTIHGDGRFETEWLLPGRYVLALRVPGHPPAEASVVVPPEDEVALRVDVPRDRLSLELRPTAAGPGQDLRCVLTRAFTSARVPDRRELVVGRGGRAIFNGLSAGRWHLDVPAWGATTDVVLDATGGPRSLALDLEELALGSGEVHGRVIRLDSSPVSGVAVTARSVDEVGGWGRYALTDSDGEYRIRGVPPGPAVLRVENRRAVFWRLPVAPQVAISPSEPHYRGFVLDE